MASVWGELKRRNVVKVAVAYAIVGWILVEVSSTVLPIFEAPDWIVQVFTFFVILGFPLALILSWAYEITPEGIKLERNVAAGESIIRVTGRKLDFAIIGLLLIAVGFLVVNYVLVDSDREAVVQETISPTIEPAAESPAPEAVEEQRTVLPNSVAVLPFRNDSPDPNNAYYASGIHEEILNHLVKLSALSVIARTSVEQYKDTEISIPEIARELNVETVMEGSVRFDAGRIRITAQLNDGVTGLHIWSETYTRDFDDIFAIESDIAMNVANALEAEFSLEEQESIEDRPTESLQAYALYLRALEARRTRPNPLEMSDAIEESLSYLERALIFDPEFAVAHVEKAYSYLAMLTREPAAPQAWIARRAELEGLARDSAERALALDPRLGAAHGVLGRIYLNNWNAAEAQDAFEQALQLTPNDTETRWDYAFFNAYTDRFDEAIGLFESVVDLRPNSAAAHHVLGIAFVFAKDHESAISAYQRAIELSPTNGTSYMDLSRIAAVRGDHAAAMEHARTAEQLMGDAINARGLSNIAYSYGLAGSREDASRLFNRLELAAATVHIDEQAWGQAYLAIGEHQQALNYLDAAANNKAGNPPNVSTNFIRLNSWNDPVLDEPEFVAVRERLGFTDL